MPISAYLRDLRAQVGSALLLVPSVTALIFDQQRRLLLLRHSDTGVWVAPGGSLDPHERPADAVVREVWEETGLVVEPVLIRGVFGGPEFEVRYRNGDRVSYVMTVFECRVLRGNVRADGEETIEARYFSETDLRDVALPEWAKVVLPGVFAPRSGAYFQSARWPAPSGLT